MACQDCVNQCTCAVTATDNTIQVSGTGNAQTPYVISAKLSAQAGNALSTQGDGLYVATNAAGGVPVYETSGRPAGSTGLVYYDTTIPGLLVKSGPTAGYTKPWNLPWGYLGQDYRQSVTGQNNLSTPVSGALVTVSTPVGRRLRASVWCEMRATGAVTDPDWRISLYRDSTQISSVVIKDFAGDPNPSPVSGGSIFGVTESTGTSHTFTFRFQPGTGANSGAGFVPVMEDGYLMIEDIGPSTTPT